MSRAFFDQFSVVNGYKQKLEREAKKKAPKGRPQVRVVIGWRIYCKRHIGAKYKALGPSGVVTKVKYAHYYNDEASVDADIKILIKNNPDYLFIKREVYK